MTEENKRENIALEVERAARELEMARVLAASSLHEGTVTHAYYSAFHYARALILTLGLEAKTHAGVNHLVRLHYVKAGRLDPALTSSLSKLQADREDANYDSAAVFTQAMADEALGKAVLFGEAATRLLKEDGYL